MEDLHEEEEGEYGEVVGHRPHVEGVVGQPPGGGQEEGGGVGQVQPHHPRPHAQHARTVDQSDKKSLV